MRQWAVFIGQLAISIILLVIVRVTWGSPVSRVAGGMVFIIIGSMWWQNYADIYKGPELTPWRRFRRITHVLMFAGPGLWFVIDGLRKMLTS